MDPFEYLATTSPLWLPALTWFVGQASANKIGQSIDEKLKKHLRWIRDPQAEKSFQIAFTEGIQLYKTERGNTEIGQIVANVLSEVVRREISGFDKIILLRQIFLENPSIDDISRVISRYIFVFEGKLISKEKVVNETKILLIDYLRISFRNTPFFTERVGFAQIIGLMEEIKSFLEGESVDIDAIEKEYLQKLSKKYEIISMQGISPRVKQDIIGVQIKDIFIDIGLSETETNSDLWSRDVIPARDIGRNLWERMQFGEIYPWGAPVLNSQSHRNRSRKSSGHKIFDADNVVIRGHPGSGKTTLLKYMCWAIGAKQGKIIGKKSISYIPIFLRAVEFGDALRMGKVNNLEDYICLEAGRFAPVMKRALVTGDVLILIDGLDEIISIRTRIKIKERVDDFHADPAFEKDRIWITTRIIGYEREGITGKFKHFKMNPLNYEQIESFVRNWFAKVEISISENTDSENKIETLLESIRSKPKLFEMATNPLLLTIMTLIVWKGRVLPNQRVQLYDLAINTLIGSWPISKRNINFEEDFIRQWMAPVAYHIFSTHNNLIDEHELTEQLNVSLHELKSVSDLDAKKQTQTLLSDISLHSGFFLPQGTNQNGDTVYGFLHQTFLEYLTAFYLAGKWEEGNLNIKEIAHDPYWREVLLLMCGHLGVYRRQAAGRLLNEIMKLSSSPYEDILNQDLLLSIQILGDGVMVSPPSIIEQLFKKVLNLWQSTKLVLLKSDIEYGVKLLANTEYASVMADVALGLHISNTEMFSLAIILGPHHFSKRISQVMRGNDLYERVDAAKLLAAFDPESGSLCLKTLSRHQDLRIRAKAIMYLYALQGLKEQEFLDALSHFDNGYNLAESLDILLNGITQKIISNNFMVLPESIQISLIRSDKFLIERDFLDKLIDGKGNGKIKLRALKVYIYQYIKQFKDIPFDANRFRKIITLFETILMGQHPESSMLDMSIKLSSDSISIQEFTSLYQTIMGLYGVSQLTHDSIAEGNSILNKLFEFGEKDVILYILKVINNKNFNEKATFLLSRLVQTTNLLNNPFEEIRLEAAKIHHAHYDAMPETVITQLVFSKNPNISFEAARIIDKVVFWTRTKPMWKLLLRSDNDELLIQIARHFLLRYSAHKPTDPRENTSIISYYQETLSAVNVSKSIWELPQNIERDGLQFELGYPDRQIVDPWLKNFAAQIYLVDDELQGGNDIDPVMKEEYRKEAFAVCKRLIFSEHIEVRWQVCELLLPLQNLDAKAEVLNPNLMKMLTDTEKPEKRLYSVADLTYLYLKKMLMKVAA